MTPAKFCQRLSVIKSFTQSIALTKDKEKEKELFGKELFIRFTASAFRKLLSVCVFSYFPFGFEGMMWDLILSVADHCLSFYLTRKICIIVIKNTIQRNHMFVIFALVLEDAMFG